MIRLVSRILQYTKGIRLPHVADRHGVGGRLLLLGFAEHPRTEKCNTSEDPVSHHPYYVKDRMAVRIGSMKRCSPCLPCFQHEAVGLLLI